MGWALWVNLLLVVAVWSYWSGHAAAQGTIPNGVFVRHSGGTVWLVLDDQRVNVPMWSATDAQIGALPPSEAWAVMNDAGAIVAGQRPAWLTEATVNQPAAPSVAVREPAPQARRSGEVRLDTPEYVTRKTPGGGLNVQGIVRNTGDVPAAGIEIVVSLVGSDGKTVGSAKSYIGPSVLDPGSTAGWLATIQDAPQFKDILIESKAEDQWSSGQYWTEASVAHQGDRSRLQRRWQTDRRQLRERSTGQVGTR